MIFGSVIYQINKIQMDLIWNNPDITVAFEAQTVTPTESGKNFSDYNFFVIYYAVGASKGLGQCRIITKNNIEFLMIPSFSTTTYYTYSRKTIINNLGATFYDGYRGSEQDSGYCIPYKIYGIRT